MRPPLHRTFVLSAIYLGVCTLWMGSLRGSALLDADATLVVGWIALAALLGFGAARGPDVSVAWLVGGAAWLQLVATLLLWPALSDDLLRYRADARAWWSGHSPYAHTPRQLIDAGALADDPLLPHRELHALYLPTSQAAFILIEGVDRALPGERLAAARPDGPHPWRAALPELGWTARGGAWRLAFGGAAVATTAWIALALRRRGESVATAAWFGWHPLVFVEIGGMGHQDALGALLLVAGALSLETRPGRAGAWIAASALVKPWAGALGLFALAGPGRARLAGGALAVLGLGAGLVGIQGGAWGLLATAQTFAGHWEANGVLYGLARALAPADGVSAVLFKQAWRALTLIGLGGVALGLLWRRAEPVSAALALMLAALLLSPVAYPWYLVVPLALTPLARGTVACAATLAWSATICVAHLLWRTPDWVLPTHWLLVELVPVVVVAALAIRRQALSASIATSGPTPHDAR